MNSPLLSLVSAISMGLGATLTLDLWSLFLKFVFKITLPNYCLVGRWLCHMPEGTFYHANIASAPQKRAECVVGWIAHYMLGILFAIAFVALAGKSWLQSPTPISAIGFGIVTVLVPFLIMQPALGLGFAASKTPNPTQARLRSLMTHTVFGLGLYLFGLLASRLLWG